MYVSTFRVLVPTRKSEPAHCRRLYAVWMLESAVLSFAIGTFVACRHGFGRLCTLLSPSFGIFRFDLEVLSFIDDTIF